MGPEWVLTAWPLPVLSQQQGVPRADSAPQTQTSMCVHTHTHTHTCCMHPPHAHTSPYTDLHKNRHTHASTHRHTHVHTPIHRNTYIHADWQAHKPPVCKRAGAQDTHRAGSTTPTSPPASSSLLKGLAHLRVGPHCSFCVPQRPRLLWTTTVFVSSRKSCEQILEP